MSKTNHSNIALGCEEDYKASPHIGSFKYVDNIVNGITLSLSIMMGGYPLLENQLQFN